MSHRKHAAYDSDTPQLTWDSRLVMGQDLVVHPVFPSFSANSVENWKGLNCVLWIDMLDIQSYLRYLIINKCCYNLAGANGRFSCSRRDSLGQGRAKGPLLSVWIVGGVHVAVKMAVVHRMARSERMNAMYWKRYHQIVSSCVIKRNCSDIEPALFRGGFACSPVLFTNNWVLSMQWITLFG